MRRFSRRGSKAANELIHTLSSEPVDVQPSASALPLPRRSQRAEPQSSQPSQQDATTHPDLPPDRGSGHPLRRSPGHNSALAAANNESSAQSVPSRIQRQAHQADLQPDSRQQETSASLLKPGGNRGSGKRAAASAERHMGSSNQALPQQQRRRQAGNAEAPLVDEKPFSSSPSAVQATKGRDSSAAMTVVEAQELGEQSRFRDDAMWALDGLTPNSAPGTKRESLATLLEICANRRGRLALRSTGLADSVLAVTAMLTFNGDAALALTAAAMLLAFCQADADPRLLGRSDVAQLARKLLLFTGAVPGGDPLSSRTLRVLQEPPYPRLLPREASVCPQSVALAALSGVLDPHNSIVNVDPLKHSLRNAGLLEVAAQLAADHGQALYDAVPTMHTVQALWRLHRALLVLENSCFACVENEGHLVDMEVTRGVPPMVTRTGIAHWLVQHVELLGQRGLVLGLKKDCLRVLLAVLMNMTQNNEAGRAKVVGARAIEAVPPLLVRILQSGQDWEGSMLICEDLGLWVDELSGCLGLLINLVEHDKELRARLRSVRLGGVGDGAHASGLVALLSQLMAAATLAAQPLSGTPDHQGRQLDGDTVQRRSSTGGEEVTLDNLEDGHSQGAASIVEVYAAILLGFLIEGDPGAQAEAAALLPGKSIKPVMCAVTRCLHFYINAGAITKSTEESLRELLISLGAQQSTA